MEAKLFLIKKLKDIENQKLHSTIKIYGWVNRIRDHGSLVFIDLRDFYANFQLVFNQELNPNVYNKAKGIKLEYVLSVTGKLVERNTQSVNKKSNLGNLELIVDDFEILNSAKNLPFSIQENHLIQEDLRLKYRYIDLRRKKMQENMFFRHKVFWKIREFLNNNDFIDLETPILNKSTPEGARDFLIPSRINQNQFYALPQSPQLFKQLLMIAGFPRYYQITKCFRDEDLRANRQPEFTQLDLEMSFLEDKEALLDLIEKLIQFILKEVYEKEINIPFKRIPFKEAIEKYGTDKPDLRNPLIIKDLSFLFQETEFKIFADILKGNGKILGIHLASNAKTFSRKIIDSLTQWILSIKGKGLAWIKLEEKEKWTSNILKFLSKDIFKVLKEQYGFQENDILFLVSDTSKNVYPIASQLRDYLKEYIPDLIDEKALQFAWVYDYPLFEYNSDSHSYESLHHPFTRPKKEYIEKLDHEPEKVLSDSYDLVLNGEEIGGGSLRIFDVDLQKKIFKILKLSDEDIAKKFNFFLKALEYGTPPHGGIALGLDRFLMILQNEKSIRDVIPFPKTQKGNCLMMETPSYVYPEQLDELGIQLKENLNDPS